MTRTTSITAYRRIVDEGLLSEMRTAVYVELFQSGPLTGAELDERLRGARGGRGHYHKRLSELRDLGVAKELGVRECKITGRDAIAWDVTPDLPKRGSVANAPARPTRRQLEKALAAARQWARDEQSALAAEAKRRQLAEAEARELREQLDDLRIPRVPKTCGTCRWYKPPTRTVFKPEIGRCLEHDYPVDACAARECHTPRQESPDSGTHPERVRDAQAEGPRDDGRGVGGVTSAAPPDAEPSQTAEMRSGGAPIEPVSAEDARHHERRADKAEAEAAASAAARKPDDDDRQLDLDL